ncbi:MAG: hypothetical protein JRC86_13065, partial [Deltaproteobacteria bacterium]|nr:hypothetical protein [Deltaproteobacteria bacterium]
MRAVETGNRMKEAESDSSRYTLPQILAKNAESAVGKSAAIREKAYGIWQTCSWE